MASSLQQEHGWEWLIIALGAAIFGLSMALFMVPFKVAPGGVSGLAVILQHFTTVSPALWMLAFNLPIFYAGIKVLGGRFMFRTLYGTLLCSAFTWLFNDHLQLRMHLPPGQELLAPLFGSVVMGVGLGMIIRAGAATSGSGTVARIIAHKIDISETAAINLVNSTIILAGGLAFQNWIFVMHGFMSLFISSWVIDLFVEGLDYARAVFVISNRTQDVADAVMTKVSRGATALRGRGLFSDREREVLLVVVTRSQVGKAVALIKKVDPAAFVIVVNVYEVLGRGFRRRY